MASIDFLYIVLMLCKQTLTAVYVCLIVTTLYNCCSYYALKLFSVLFWNCLLIT